MTTSMELLRSLISSAPVVLLTAPGCGACIEISTWLSENCKSSEWNKIFVPSLADDYEEDLVHELVDLLKETTGAKSYPFCFYRGSYLSDTEELKHMVRSHHTDLKFDDM